MTSSFEIGFLALGCIVKELFASRIIVTGSLGLRCISFIHFLGKDNMYVDLPVNCILRTSFSLDTVLNMDLGICFNKRIMITDISETLFQDSLQWSFRNLEVLDCSEHVSTRCF